ncbi:MAG: YdeI/OmpD-associated family protein [Patescibacteria group bacterium]
MAIKVVSTTEVHTLPADLKAALAKTPKALATWNATTPLARSEWICWIISGKKAETRGIRIKKGLSKLSGGMRRPCCWAGCMHRKDKPLSRSQKFVLSRQK